MQKSFGSDILQGSFTILDTSCFSAFKVKLLEKGNHIENE